MKKKKNANSTLLKQTQGHTHITHHLLTLILLIIAILNGASSHRRLVTACQYGLVDSLVFVPRSLFLCLVDLKHSSHHWANKYKNTLMCCGGGGDGCYRFAPGEQSALSAFTRRKKPDRQKQSQPDRQTDREGDRQSVKQIERETGFHQHYHQKEG